MLVAHSRPASGAAAALTVIAMARCVASPSVALGQPLGPEARLREALTAVVAAQGLPGATAAVSRNGAVIAVAVGHADRERRKPMKPSGRMFVGSAGKPFFAFVAASLAAEGKLDLDARVSTWLGREPWFSRVPNAGQITLRQLLAHRSGIPNHVADSSFAAFMRSADSALRRRGLTPAEQIEFVLDQPALFPAGTGFGYSDTGYLIAALALERAVGTTYYQELRARVLGPLHLTGTIPSDRPDLPGLTQGYLTDRPTPKGFSGWGLPDKMVVRGRVVINPVYEWTGGGLISTAPDLARWMETLFEQAPWKATGEAMVADRAADSPYGLGIFVRETADGLLYFHPGAFSGYFTQVGYSPSLGVGVAFQTNRTPADGGAAIHAILEAVR